MTFMTIFNDPTRTDIIYLATNKIDGDVYVGQSTVIRRQERWDEHRWGISSNKNLQAAIARDGWNNFTWDVIDTHKPLPENSRAESDNDKAEIIWISLFRRVLGRNHVYNIANGGSKPPSRLGKNHSEETRKKISTTRILDPKIEQQAIELRIQGKLGKEIREHLKIGKGTLGRIIKRNNLTLRSFSGKTWILVDGKRVWKDKV